MSNSLLCFAIKILLSAIFFALYPKRHRHISLFHKYKGFSLETIFYLDYSANYLLWQVLYLLSLQWAKLTSTKFLKNLSSQAKSAFRILLYLIIAIL